MVEHQGINLAFLVWVLEAVKNIITFEEKVSYLFFSATLLVSPSLTASIPR